MSVINCIQSGAEVIQVNSTIPVSGWTNSNSTYSYAITVNGVDDDMSVVSYEFDNSSQSFQTATINWDTQENKIVLTTSSLPSGTLELNLVVAG